MNRLKTPEFSVLYNEKKWSKYELIDDLFNDVDAVVILTEWDIYAALRLECNIEKNEGSWLGLFKINS